MFAPNHRAVADELVRVCRPGGTIGMLNFTPEGLAAGFFGALAPYAPPPPPGALSPLIWGNEEHVRQLFGDRVESLEMTRKTYVEKADSPSGYRDFVKATFGPVIAIYAVTGANEGLQELPVERGGSKEEADKRFIGLTLVGIRASLGRSQLAAEHER
jgi:hypothetical protein